LLPVVVLIAVAILIWFLGTGRFGRAQTQAWIDRAGKHPKFYDFLNRHHGKFRASGHYFEFGGLFLVLYWCLDSWFFGGALRFRPWLAVVLAVMCALAAHLDELHQLKSGTRQYRRVDFLHSCCGIAIAAGIVAWQDFLRTGF